MHTFLNDLRTTLRTHRASPGFALLVVATLGIGVGATTAIFSAVNDGFLRPFPLRSPERLVMLFVDNEERGWNRIHAAPANVVDWKERVDGFQDVAHYGDFTRSAALVSGAAEPQLVTVGQVSGNFFEVIGVAPYLGRAFTSEETWAGHEPAVVLRHDTWRRVFNGDPDIVNKTVRIDEVAHQVIGVMPRQLKQTLTDADVWVPFAWTDDLRESDWFRQAHVVRAVARLQEGVTIEQADQQLSAVASGLELEYPRLNRGMEPGMQSLQPFITGDKRLPLMLLFGAVLVLQLMACANVANLVFLRSLRRDTEFAVRAAMGAGRSRLIRQNLTESLVLASAGTIAGVGLAALGLRLLSILSPAQLGVRPLSPDWRVAAFVLATMLASTLIFGLLPAWISTGRNLAQSLMSRSRSASRQQVRLTHGITVLQVSSAVVLVAGAGLLMQSLHSLRNVETGINPENILTFEVTPPKGNYPNGAARVD